MKIKVLYSFDPITGQSKNSTVFLKYSLFEQVVGFSKTVVPKDKSLICIRTKKSS